MYAASPASSPSVVQVSNASTPCNVSLCGKVLTISNDGKLVVVADTVSSPSQVYIYDSSGTTAPVDLVIPGETPTAAAFSPDQLKLFILTSTAKMYVYSPVDALSPVKHPTCISRWPLHLYRSAGEFPPEITVLQPGQGQFHADLRAACFKWQRTNRRRPQPPRRAPVQRKQRIHQFHPSL